MARVALYFSGKRQNQKKRVMMLKLVNWHDQEKVMNLEEIDELKSDEKSQEVDSRDEVMHVGKKDQWFLE